MVIAHPVSSSDNRSNETLIADQDGNVINSNSLESVPSLVSDVRKLYKLQYNPCELPLKLFIFFHFLHKRHTALGLSQWPASIRLHQIHQLWRSSSQNWNHQIEILCTSRY